MNSQQFVVLLSRRERDVVDLLLQGKSNKQIALSLGISERTVEFHLNNIYAKAHVASRVELVLKLGGGKGGILGNPVESTVEIGSESDDNGNQPARMRAAQAWRNLVSLIKKEVAMTMKISFEDIENYLQRHLDIFTIAVFLTASLTIRYVVFGIGLYIGGSYLLLELLLIFAAVRFGELLNGTWDFRRLPTILFAGMLPLLVLGFDQLYLNTILRYTGAASVLLPHLCTTAEWLISPDGTTYLSTQLSIQSDLFWFAIIGEMLVMFLLSRVFGKRPGNSNLAPA
ncbi:MAG: helix-turn-helix transcriptional regulator [Anaerolineae bacterium]|nr:helix-turn-helix transcriptional regulator [Anaerolineae bacterium]